MLISVKNSHRLLSILGLSFLLLACSSNQHDDLEQWVAAEKAKQPSGIPPIKPIVEPEQASYEAASLRSPFKPETPDLIGPDGVLETLPGSCLETVQPDVERRKEDLENLPMETYKMVGTLGWADGERVAVIQSVAGEYTGTLYRLSVGNYIGMNHGRITKIEEGYMEIEEMTPDGNGCWETRITPLTLDE